MDLGKELLTLRWELVVMEGREVVVVLFLCISRSRELRLYFSPVS